jgi:hypothetical protein
LKDSIQPIQHQGCSHEVLGDHFLDWLDMLDTDQLLIEATIEER